MNDFDYIKDAFDKRPVQVVSGKKYCINPLTDHVPITEPALLTQIIDEASTIIDYRSADFLIGEEDRGGYICSLFSVPWQKPFTLTKWNPSGFAGELEIDFRNAYTKGSLYLNGITPELKKAIIVEDMIDTGGTIIAMVQLLRSAGIEILDIFAVARKEDYSGSERIAAETGLVPKVLVAFTSGEALSEVTWRYQKS